MRGTLDEHFAFLKAFFVDLRYVAWAGSWRLKGPDFSVELQPFNDRIDEVGTRMVAVRLMADEGRHLVALIEMGRTARITYATKAVRPQCEVALVKLAEAFG